ncbi:MAG: hypothetical protein KDC52_17045, partial [Ignavibacteriae bacterium]|nr:hypothetical protein [Ignavibacteriota bacterium]
TNLFIADFHVPSSKKMITIESNSYLETEKECQIESDNKNKVEMIVLFQGKEKIEDSTLVNFINKGISGVIQFEDSK